jgi:hypothetical protein
MYTKEIDILLGRNGCYIPVLSRVLLEKTLTSLRKQLDNALLRIGVIREKLHNCNEYPPCCLIFHTDNRISCDTLGPMPEEAFLTHCESCRATMKELVDYIYRFYDGN